MWNWDVADGGWFLWGENAGVSAAAQRGAVAGRMKLLIPLPLLLGALKRCLEVVSMWLWGEHVRG
jgi:hypothetical protein